MTVLNRTVFDIPLTWNRTRFESTRNKCRIARKLIETSINVQYEKQMRGIFFHNIEIDENMKEIDERLLKYHDKLRVLDNMIELASQSLRIYFDRRMQNVRAIVNEHCNIIQQIIDEEAEHWKEIHAVMNQNLLNPGDIRSRNNNYPRIVQKSPASNIETIDEETDENEEEHVSKLLNGKTLTPLLTQMIRKSRIQSKRLTIVPPSKLNIPLEQEYSIPRKEEQFTMHIIPLSTARQPLEIVDTTFVIKPEESIIEGDPQNDDEPNGTYRAANQHYRSHLFVNLPERLLIDSQPKIPARLCFSPTMLQEATQLPEDDFHEQSSSSSDHNDNEINKGTIKTLLLPIDQNRTHVKQYIEDNRRFGQTFLLDIIKTEQQFDDIRNEYIRPTIPDDDVIIINNPKQLVSTIEPVSHTTNNIHTINPSSTTVQETVPVKTRTRTTTKAKTKSVIVSARKTRSAAKIIAEREATATIDRPLENKRKTRKRKQSKSNDRPVQTSDEENEPPRSNSTNISDARRKTKRRKKSKADTRNHHQDSDDDDDEQMNNKRKTRKRINDRQEISNENETTRRKMKKSKEPIQSESENDQATTTTNRKKTKSSTNDDDEKKSKVNRRKQKTKRSKKDDEESASKYRSTRSPAKNNHRST